MDLLASFISDNGVQLLTMLIVAVFHELRADRSAGRPESVERSAFAALAVAGAMCGAISTVVLPQPAPVGLYTPATSLVAAPLLGGALMQWIGTRRRARGRDPGSIATFMGGALFAFGYALARLVVLRIPM